MLFTILANPVEESQVAVLSLETGDQTIVVRGGASARYLATGHLVYAAGSTLWAVGFDVNRLEAVGDAVPVLEGVLTKGSGTADFGVSENGSLIYVPTPAVLPPDSRTLVWVDHEGLEEAVPAPPAAYEAPRVSPDGRYVAVEVRAPDNTDVMVYDLQRETLTPLTFDPSFDGYPLWSPDGERVLFSSRRAGGVLNIYSKAADGTGSVERVTTSDTNQTPSSWSADGRFLVIADTSGGQTDLRSVSVSGGNRTDGLVETESFDFLGEVSPDGRWIAYTSNDSGQVEVYVRPFPNVDDGRWQISRGSGYAPVWAPDGQELFFRRFGSYEMMVTTVETQPTFSPGNPEVLFAAPYRVGLLQSAPSVRQTERDRLEAGSSG